MKVPCIAEDLPLTEFPDDTYTVRDGHSCGIVNIYRYSGDYVGRQQQINVAVNSVDPNVVSILKLSGTFRAGEYTYTDRYKLYLQDSMDVELNGFLPPDVYFVITVNLYFSVYRGGFPNFGLDEAQSLLVFGPVDSPSYFHPVKRMRDEYKTQYNFKVDTTVGSGGYLKFQYVFIGVVENFSWSKFHLGLRLCLNNHGSCYAPGGYYDYSYVLELSGVQSAVPNPPPLPDDEVSGREEWTVVSNNDF